MDTMSLSTTDKLAGRYRVLQKLGEGCFAETFLAEDELLPDAFRCVVKKLKTAFSEEDKQQIAKRLFDSEAHSLHRLGFHGQIPQLFAHFEENNNLYIVEEYIQGTSLYHELSKGQRWSEDYVLKLLMDLLEVLKFVHQKQVIHRDLKPSNIIRRARDGRLVLIDFGAVKQVSNQILDNDNSVVTHTVVVGTPGYMPGEQLLGNPRKSSDVYAVGMLAISALTGLNPARGELPVDEFTAELLWHNQANVSPELMTILDKMVAYDFRQRYPSAKEAFEAIQSLTRSRQFDAPTVLKEASGTIEIPADHGEGSPIQSGYVPAFKGKPDSKTGTVIINLKSLGSTILNRVGGNSLLPPPPSRQVIDQTAGGGLRSIG
jgi:eukaryotic-like serine/threonine-protein kinase